MTQVRKICVVCHTGNHQGFTLVVREMATFVAQTLRFFALADRKAAHFLALSREADMAVAYAMDAAASAAAAAAMAAAHVAIMAPAPAPEVVTESEPTEFEPSPSY